jgi:hypothetical protein
MAVGFLVGYQSTFISIINKIEAMNEKFGTKVEAVNARFDGDGGVNAKLQRLSGMIDATLKAQKDMLLIEKELCLNVRGLLQAKASADCLGGKLVYDDLTHMYYCPGQNHAPDKVYPALCGNIPNLDSDSH